MEVPSQELRTNQSSPRASNREVAATLFVRTDEDRRRSNPEGFLRCEAQAIAVHRTQAQSAMT
jgi:hypothetical protein